MVEGKFGVSAKVLCDSISEAGVRLLTFEVTYARLVLSELNTHRMLSRNSASSRAIPFKKMQENLTGRPTRFGEANPGMQDTGVDYEKVVSYSDGFGRVNGSRQKGCLPGEFWEYSKGVALDLSSAMYEAGYHKQVYNRLTEPFQMMKTVISATEWNNFIWLRDDGAADPSIAELARCIREARDASTPELLKVGEWHLPYVDSSRDAAGKQYFWMYLTDTEKIAISVEEAIKVSCARSAAVSFRNVDYGLEKCKEVYERLVGDDRKHASALEHQACPMKPENKGFTTGQPVNMPCASDTWEFGVSHSDRKDNLWSGNFRGWVQHRKTIAGENKEG